MPFEPLTSSSRLYDQLLKGPDDKPLQFNSLAAALKAAAGRGGEQAVVLDQDGLYHLAERDNCRLAGATKSEQYEPSVVAFETAGKASFGARPAAAPGAALLQLLLKGDGQFDAQEVALLARQITDEQGRLRPGKDYSNLRDQLVEAFAGSARGSFEALLARAIKQKPRDVETPDMAILNLLVASPQGAALIIDKIDGMRTASGLLTVPGRALVERLLGTGSGRVLIDQMVAQALAADVTRAVALLRTLSSSTTARSHFYQHLAHPEQEANPLARDGSLRSEACDYVRALQDLSRPDEDGHRVFDLDAEIFQPDHGFVDRDKRLTPGGRSLGSLLEEGSGTRGVMDLVALNDHPPAEADREVVRRHLTTPAGRVALAAADAHLRPEVQAMAHEEQDRIVRKHLIDDVYSELTGNRYGKLRRAEGQINRAGPCIDCYDAAWDIVSSMQGVADAQPRGQQHVVKGLRLDGNANKQRFLGRLRVGDVLHLGPPGTHWAVYMGRDAAGSPQIMHGNWKVTQYVPDGKGDTRQVPGGVANNTKRGVVITTLDHALASYEGNIQAVYRPSEGDVPAPK